VGMRLSEAAKSRATVEVEFEGTNEKLTIVHNPSVFTAAFEAKLRHEIEKSDVQSDILCGMLAEMLVSWDLVDDEGSLLGSERAGETVPIDLDSLRLVPMSILTRVSEAIKESHNPSPNDAAPTRSGSFS
jgi:hypothetical protein